MKIPEKIAAFKDETIIVVTGRQDAVIYKAWHNTISRIDAFKIPSPRYSDNKGQFGRRGRSNAAATSGGVGETRDRDLIRDFLHEFKQRIKKIGSFSKIYILAPSKIKNKIGSALPKKWQNKIRAVIDGNYYKQHPLYIIRKISELERRVNI